MISQRTIEETRRFTALANRAALRDGLRVVLHDLRFRLSETPTGFVATRGSRISTRLFGAFFVRQERLPVRAEIAIAEGTPATVVTIRLTDDWGRGIRTGLPEIYGSYFASLYETLEGRLRLIPADIDEVPKLDARTTKHRRSGMRAALILGAVVAGTLVLLEIIRIGFSWVFSDR